MRPPLWYSIAIAVLLVAGLIPALAFIGQHRPRNWRRLAAWDASGFVIVAALIYIRNLALLITRWPGLPPRSTGDAVFGIVSLLAIDALFVLRIVSWRSFAQRDRERVEEGRDTAITSAAQSVPGEPRRRMSADPSGTGPR